MDRKKRAASSMVATGFMWRPRDGNVNFAEGGGWPPHKQERQKEEGCIRRAGARNRFPQGELDVTFNEDASRTRKDHASLNLAIIRHATLNTLKRDNTKLSVKKKQLKAAWDNDYRTKLINSS
jgi:hypothetical protein